MQDERLAQAYIFDGSAQQNRKSLNSESPPGSELQSDVVTFQLSLERSQLPWLAM